jgi:hypothetical protein
LSLKKTPKIVSLEKIYKKSLFYDSANYYAETGAFYTTAGAENDQNYFRNKELLL